MLEQEACFRSAGMLDQDDIGLGTLCFPAQPGGDGHANLVCPLDQNMCTHDPHVPFLKSLPPPPPPPPPPPHPRRPKIKRRPPRPPPPSPSPPGFRNNGDDEVQDEPRAFAWEEEAEDADDEEDFEEQFEEFEEEETAEYEDELEAAEEAEHEAVGMHEGEVPRGDDLDEQLPGRSDAAARVEAGADRQGGAETAVTKEAWSEAWGEVVEGPLNMPLEAFRPAVRDASAGGAASAAAGAPTLLRDDVADDLLRQRNRSAVFMIVGGVAAILLAAWALLRGGGSGTKGYAKALSQDDTTSHDVQATADLSTRSRLRRATPRPAKADSATVDVDAAGARVAGALDEHAARRLDVEAAKPLKVGRGGTDACTLDIEWARAAGPARVAKASELD